MKSGCHLYFLACSITQLNAQGTADGCVTCAVGNLFKTGMEDWILPAAGSLQFLVPDSVPATDTTIPKKEPDKQWTDNIPGSVDQTDIEIETITSASEKCDPNGAGVCNPYWADRFTYLQP